MTERRITNERTGQNWKPIPSSPSYEASECGLVRRAAPGRGARVGRVLRPHCDRGGYLIVDLSEGGEVRTRKVHQLVAEAHIGPRPEGMDTCHANGVRTDNRACNLRYDTRSGNFADMEAHGTKRRGERMHTAKLTEPQVQDILRDPRRGRRGGASAVGAEHGVNPQTVRHIWNRATWAHVADEAEEVTA